MQLYWPRHSPERRKHGILKYISAIQKQENTSDHDLEIREEFTYVSY